MYAVAYKRVSISYPVAVGLITVCVGLVSSSILDAGSSRRLITPRLRPTGQENSVAIHTLRSRTVAEKLKQTLEYHDESRLDHAIAAWSRVELPDDREVWRHVALAVAHLYDYRYDHAAAELTKANLCDSEIAAVHYFKGLLCLSRAELANDCSDALPHNPFQPVSSDAGLSKATYQVHCNKVKSRYQLEAMVELEKAIQYESSTESDLLLTTDAPNAPTVGELLSVLGGDNFVGKAHGLLALLNLEHGRPERAEHHIDGAKTRGIKIPYGYRLAGEQYTELGRTAAADRVFAKAKAEGDILGSSQESEAKMTELFNQLLGW